MHHVYPRITRLAQALRIRSRAPASVCYVFFQFLLPCYLGFVFSDVQWYFPQIIRNILLMKKAVVIVVTLLVLAGLVRWCSGARTVSYGPGVVAPDEPVQVDLRGSPTFIHEGFFLTPVAEFDVHARVLSRKNYTRDGGAAISPVDLALGWGRMSDESVYGQLKIRQLKRFYIWRTRQMPIPRREIEVNSANMHMIPANRHIERSLKRVRKGDLVRFNGRLVNVEGTDGFRWRTSTTRTDTGNGACELVFVESFEIIKPDGR